ncbi:MAG: amino acid ABC transporter substrate-binding protein [Ruminococcaceae bacterium]|nr:amino acid ABC transporter substrate-binding protein [Oscillospiraceae bacterium]
MRLNICTFIVLKTWRIKEMKKMLTMVLVMLIVVMSLCVFTSCKNTDEEESSKKSFSSQDVSEKEESEKDVSKRKSKKRKTESKTVSKERAEKGNREENPVLKVATNAEFPPFEYMENGEIVGAEIEMAQLIAEKIGAELEFVNMEFDSVVSDVVSGKCDIAISAITITDYRKEIAEVSVPYYVVSQAIIVMENSEIKVAADLKGKTISCQEGTAGEQFILDNKYDIQSYKTGADAIAALTAGKVDAVVIDEAVARALSAENRGTKVLDEMIMTEEYGVVVGKGNNKLLRQINKAITELKQEGRLDEIFKKYGL